VLLTLGTPVLSGYTRYGSLFRGSGAWVVKAVPLPFGGVSDHGAAAVGDVIYLFGGARVNTSNVAPLLGAWPCAALLLCARAALAPLSCCLSCRVASLPRML
jgi:hypothetical protein